MDVTNANVCKLITGSLPIKLIDRSNNFLAVTEAQADAALVTCLAYVQACMCVCACVHVHLHRGMDTSACVCKGGCPVGVHTCTTDVQSISCREVGLPTKCMQCSIE